MAAILGYEGGYPLETVHLPAPDQCPNTIGTPCLPNLDHYNHTRQGVGIFGWPSSCPGLSADLRRPEYAGMQSQMGVLQGVWNCITPKAAARQQSGTEGGHLPTAVSAPTERRELSDGAMHWG